MKYFYLLASFLFLAAFTQPAAYQARNGDIIFQTSRSSQSLAIQKATNSRYSHMGIVYVRDGMPVVFEAIEPVKITGFKEWTARGVDGSYVVKRLKDADRLLTPESLKHMRDVGKRFEGKHYDLTFEWSDDRIYCSELVWKIFNEALGIEIGKLRKLSDFDLSHPDVQQKLKERFGDSIPLDEPVISPTDMFDSKMLVTVWS